MFWLWIKDLYEISFDMEWDFPYDTGIGNKETQYLRVIDFYKNLYLKMRLQRKVNNEI